MYRLITHGPPVLLGSPCPHSHGGGFLLAYGDCGVRSALTVRRESAAASVGAAVVSKAWRHHMKNPLVSSQGVGSDVPQ